MSRFFSGRLDRLVPYVPGEQPQDKKYVKLNTNESPFPPLPEAIEQAAAEAARLELYSDPECRGLVKRLAAVYGVNEDQVVATNGSDEALDLAFQAFADEASPLAFADITYGFYPVFADKHRIPYEIIPLKEDFTIDINDYIGIEKTIVIANPNAPTAIALKPADIEKILVSNPDNVVIIDEAYVDFGAESCIPFVSKYDNLLVVQTFSKSRSMAGARLGYAIGCPALIADMNTVRYSTNPYNINRMTMAAGEACLDHDEYNKANCAEVMRVRAWAEEELKKLGFMMTESCTNFIFARHPKVSGEDIYRKLKDKGVLVRHFTLERIKDYNRITVGSREQMEILIEKVSEILKEADA